MDGIAKVAVQGIHIAAVPGDFNSVADGALHAGSRGGVALGDFRVKALGYSVDIVMVAHGQQNGVAQELIALDVRRYADLMQNFCHRQLITILRYRLRAAGGTGGFQYTADQNVFIKRFNEKERETVIQQILLHFLTLECTGHKERCVAAAGILGFIALFDRDGVQIRHKRIQQNGLRVLLQQGFERLRTVFLAYSHINSLGFQCLAAKLRGLRAGIGHQKLDLIHPKIPPLACSAQRTAVFAAPGAVIRICGCLPLSTLRILPYFTISCKQNRTFFFFKNPRLFVIIDRFRMISCPLPCPCCDVVRFSFCFSFPVLPFS